MSRLPGISIAALSSLIGLACLAQDNPITVPITSTDAVLLHVQIKKLSGDPKQSIQDFSLEPGQATQNLYLHDGTGKYDITWFFSKDPDSMHLGPMVFGDNTTVYNSDTRSGFTLPGAEVESDNPEIVALSHQITDGKNSDRERAQALHDWVASNIRYDAAAYFQNTYQDIPNDAVGVLHRRLAVCAGYSNLFAALSRAAGFSTKVILGAIIWPITGQTWENTGDKQSHAWNEILIDGQWHIMDTTWDSGSMDFRTQTFTSKLKQDYCDIDEATFSIDHHKLSESSN